MLEEFVQILHLLAYYEVVAVYDFSGIRIFHRVEVDLYILEKQFSESL